MEFKRLLLDLILPPRCGLCREFLPLTDPEEHLCRVCQERLAGDREPACPVCGGIPSGPEDEGGGICGDCRANPPAFDRAAPAALFSGPLAEAIKDFKYRRRMELAAVLGEVLAGINWPASFPKRFDLILPVPLHPSRLRARGFNQAAVLSRHLSAMGPLASNLLIRTRRTRPQVELDGRARQDNVKDAFNLTDPGGVRDRKVLLVDDVITTGATCRECARVLKSAGAEGVFVRSIARSVGF